MSTVSSSDNKAYAELFCLSNFSFLKSAAHPEELVQRADELGYEAIAIVDECSFAGCVRAWSEGRERAISVLYGASFRIENGLYLCLVAKNKDGYGDIASLITRCRRSSVKGQYNFSLSDVTAIGVDSVISYLTFLQKPPQKEAETVFANSSRYLIRVGFRPSLLINIAYTRGEKHWNTFLARLAEKEKISLCASGLVRMSEQRQKPLLDLVYAIDRNVCVVEIAEEIEENAEYYLKTKEKLYKEYCQEWIEASVRLARKCAFDLKEISYQYPSEVVPADKTPAQYLRELVEEGALQRWPKAIPAKVRCLIEHELTLISEMRYEYYFLTVYDVVRFAKSKGILCQGRGSAANSVICFCLYITEVNPAEMELLFERFISKERSEPPDIDIDFENARREEVLQFLYEKYGRSRAALTATVIRYRSKSSYRDVARALGYDTMALSRLSKCFSWRDRTLSIKERIAEAGFNPETQKVRWLMYLAEALKGFPRHLSQHTGGMVICHGRLDRMVPIENAAMEKRTVVQWDKDDIDALGILKVDCLALGMLTAIQYALQDLAKRLGRESLSFADIPKNDPAVYDMICRADTIGVFQIESRAQMSMLPRLRPRNFYDLVIEVSIVRPGPIQGDMVHPYLRRRDKIDPITYPSKEVERVLRRTLGIPIFQEQVIKLAMVAAGFSAGEADRLRRSMAAWRRSGTVEEHKKPLIQGMVERGYSQQYAEQIFNQIRGFGEYGFPESHAASFSILVYYSSWIKYHHPDIFLTALLNAQPMGFYRPAQLVEDARRHGVNVIAPCVKESQWQSKTVKPMTVQLGLHQIRGVHQEDAEKLIHWREKTGDVTIKGLIEASGLQRATLELLAKADALRTLSHSRHHALWDALAAPVSVFERADGANVIPLLPMPTQWQESIADYRYTAINQKFHPMLLLRPQLSADLKTSVELATNKDNDVRLIGLIVNRQRPGKGNVLFMTLEDEFGWINCVVFSDVAKQYRKEIMAGHVLEVMGRVQVEREVIHIIVSRATDRSSLIKGKFSRSRDFR